jgi:hypothetical protein
MVRGSNPAEVEIFRARPDRSRGPSSLESLFPVGKAARAWRLPPTPHVAVRLKSRPITLLPAWVFTACCRVNFTFYLLPFTYFTHSQHRGPTNLTSMCSGGASPWDIKLTSHICLMPRLRMSGAVLLIPPTWLTARTGTTLPFCITFALPTQK